jgi:hypothetical protein
VIGQNTGETAKVEGDIYFAPLSMIPPKFFKFRLKTAMFDMHVTLKRFHISMDNDIGNKSYSLNDIYQHYKAVKLLSTTKCELSVRMSTGTIAKLG